MNIFRSSVAAALATAVATTGLTAAGLVAHDAAGQQVIVQAEQTALQQKLDTLLADPRFTGSQVGLVVRDAVTGEELYDRDGGSRLLPASNLKLFSSTAAMDALGPDFRFHTDALSGAQVLDGKLRGDLYLKGYGDPTTLASDYAALAQQVAAAGIRRVDGNIVADDTYFDSVRLGDTWSWDDEPFYYSAQISALTVAPNTDYDSGTVIVQSAPGATAGSPAQLTLVPRTSAVQLVGSVTTGPAGSANTLSTEREHGTDVVHVSGSVPLGSGTGLEWVTVWEPTSYAADVFRRALVAAGVEVRGGLRSGTTPSGARLLAHDTSMTLGEAGRPGSAWSRRTRAAAASPPARCGSPTAPGCPARTTSRRTRSPTCWWRPAPSPGSSSGTTPCRSPATRTGSLVARCAAGCATRRPRTTCTARPGR